MASVTVSDIIDFSQRVEALCEFLLEGVEKDGSADVAVIQKLMKDAADIQSIKRNSNVSIEGLDNFMRGIPETA